MICKCILIIIHFSDDSCSSKVPGLAGQESQGGAGHHLDLHSDTLHNIMLAGTRHLDPQEDLHHPMVGVTHDQHHHHGHHLHMLDIHVLLHRLVDGHHVPHGGWPVVGPVDSHVEGGHVLLHHALGH